MDKRTKKELERLENLTNAEKNLLGNLYGELFGSLITDPSGSSSEKDSVKKTESSQKRVSGNGMLEAGRNIYAVYRLRSLLQSA